VLRLHEELALLALDEQRGKFKPERTSVGLAGGLFAELLLENRIAVDDSRKKLVNVVDPKPLGDPLLDECLVKMATAKRQGRQGRH
jgi:golgi phosphoprotein 3